MAKGVLIVVCAWTGVAWADVPFVVSAPSFDWGIVSAVAVSILLLCVGLALYRKVRWILSDERESLMIDRAKESVKGRIGSDWDV